MDNQNERKPSTNGYEYDCESFPPASREYYEAVLPAHLKGLAANLAGKANVKVQDKDQGKD